jgi:hypothetical protein
MVLSVKPQLWPNNSFKPTAGVGQLIKQSSRAGGGLILVLGQKMISEYVLALIPIVFIAWVILAFTRKRTPAFASGFLWAIGSLIGVWFLCDTIESAAIGKVLVGYDLVASGKMPPHTFDFYVFLNSVGAAFAIAFCSFNLSRVLRGKEAWLGTSIQSLARASVRRQESALSDLDAISKRLEQREITAEEANNQIRAVMQALDRDMADLAKKKTKLRRQIILVCVAPLVFSGAIAIWLLYIRAA